MDAWGKAHAVRNSNPAYSDGFHTYKVVWTQHNLKFILDGKEMTTIDAGDGFWAKGGFSGENPWAHASKMAPFDQEFYIILNLAVGGVNYFGDGFRNEPKPKPWKNNSPTAPRDFWQAKNDWLATWNYRKNDNADLQVDYVKVWAL